MAFHQCAISCDTGGLMSAGILKDNYIKQHEFIKTLKYQRKMWDIAKPIKNATNSVLLNLTHKYKDNMTDVNFVNSQCQVESVLLTNV